MEYQPFDITADSIDDLTVPETSSFDEEDEVEEEIEDVWSQRLQMREHREVHERVIGMSVLEVIY
jgi:hypothetical protein